MIYSGTSRTTAWRKRKADEERAQHAECFQKVDQMFRRAAAKEAEGSIAVEPSEEVVGEGETEQLVAAEQKLRDALRNIKNQHSELAKVTGFQLQRLMTIHRYMVLLLEGNGKMDASRRAAEARWMSTTDHACRCIRSWTKTYLHLGHLPEHSQGKHAKRESVLDDEDVKMRCLEWLWSTKPQDHWHPKKHT